MTSDDRSRILADGLAKSGWADRSARDQPLDPWIRIGDFLQIGTFCQKHGFAALASHWCPCDESTVVYEYLTAGVTTD